MVQHFDFIVVSFTFHSISMNTNKAVSLFLKTVVHLDIAPFHFELFITLSY